MTTEIVAEKIVKFEALDSTMAYTLDIDIYDSTGVATANIVGDSGIIREATGNLSLYGNVVVITTDSFKLETEYLYWDSEVDSIKTDVFVRLTKGEDIITGRSTAALNQDSQPGFGYDHRSKEVIRTLSIPTPLPSLRPATAVAPLLSRYDVNLSSSAPASS